uniref:Uncharacterized protein n=1 Tax=Pyxicephalus adspersus TaxID=30357 RepID=A0AAV2ZQN8_PYXAD|nr:TPA: hypothetical protein GDO54_005092 [Pyxicephalus adspersus]
MDNLVQLWSLLDTFIATEWGSERRNLLRTNYGSQYATGCMPAIRGYCGAKLYFVQCEVCVHDAQNQDTIPNQHQFQIQIPSKSWVHFCLRSRTSKILNIPKNH